MMACFDEDDFLSRYGVKQPKGYKPEPEKKIPLWQKFKYSLTNRWFYFKTKW